MRRRTIRHATPSDAAQWLALRMALWPDEPADMLAADVEQFFRMAVPGLGAMPEAVLVAVSPNGAGMRVTGFAELSRRNYAEGCSTSPVGFLEGWYVVPEQRRRGIGRRLVAAGEAWARALGCTEFASDALVENSVSAAAHRALGFEEVEVIRCFRKALP